MFPPESPTAQPIILSCWYWTGSHYQQGAIEEANAATQTAVITPRGSLASITVSFAHISKISLSYGYVEKIQYFGSPKTYLLETLPAATHAEVEL